MKTKFKYYLCAMEDLLFSNPCSNEGKYITKHFKGIVNCSCQSLFLNSFVTWKECYIWLNDYLIEQQFEFVTHEQAIKELEQ